MDGRCNRFQRQLLIQVVFNVGNGSLDTARRLFDYGSEPPFMKKSIAYLGRKVLSNLAVLAHQEEGFFIGLNVLPDSSRRTVKQAGLDKLRRLMN